MQILIDISEGVYEYYTMLRDKGNELPYLETVIIDGTVISPKDHGLDTIVLLNEIETEIDKAYDDLDHALGTFANIVTEIIDKHRKKCKIEEDKQNK